VAPRSEDPKLIIRVISFELVQPISSRYINVTDRQTGGQTDGRLTIAIPSFALRASRGKNRSMLMAMRLRQLSSVQRTDDSLSDQENTTSCTPRSVLALR